MPGIPLLSAPSRRQGSAERRQGATQAAGAAGHGAAAQAVALQAPRQPLPHQDREDPAGPRLPDDPSAGKGTPPATPTAPRRGGMGTAAPPRWARVWCPMSFHPLGNVGDISASVTCVGRSWEAAARPGARVHPSPALPRAPPPCPQRDFPRLSPPGWGRAEDRQLNTGVFPARRCPHPAASFISTAEIFSLRLKKSSGQKKKKKKPVMGDFSTKQGLFRKL